MSRLDPLDYETILKTVHNWPPAHRLMLMQDILKSLISESTSSQAQRNTLEQVLGLLTADQPAPSDAATTSADIPPDSLTARFRGIVESPLTVAELAAAYELQMMGDVEYQFDSIRQETEQLLAQLPPEGLAELATFIEFLRFKYRATEAPAPSPAEQTTPPNPDDDPILQMIGIADVEPFAHEIDEILYGSAQ